MLKRLLPWTVRMATAADEDALYDALVALYADNAIAGSYSPDCVRAQIRKGTSEADKFAGMIGVMDAPDGRIAATVGIFWTKFWYSDENVLTESWLFVRPEYRHLGLDARLFEFAKLYRDMMREQLKFQIKLVSSVASDKRLPAKLRLWRRWGEQFAGVFLMRD